MRHYACPLLQEDVTLHFPSYSGPWHHKVDATAIADSKKIEDEESPEDIGRASVGQHTRPHCDDVNVSSTKPAPHTACVLPTDLAVIYSTELQRKALLCAR
jgi:hypothetical protein